MLQGIQILRLRTRILVKQAFKIQHAAQMIAFTMDDIERLGQALSLDLADGEKVAILMASESCDVQAGPGSGKTTMLVAKLALLAQKWTRSDVGICVLSHTNVARREIEQRIGQSQSLRKFLHYPHFIGTFQRFVNEFIAIPYLREQGIKIASIDDEKFGEKANVLLRHARYSVPRSTLQTRYARQEGRMEQVVASLRFDGANLAVSHSARGEERFPGDHTRTGQGLICLKEKLKEFGYFRYDDMYAFAEAALLRCPYLITTLQHRFPWVFVDELQDTSPPQDRLVEQLFGSASSILQRFGDKNQSIFQANADLVLQPELFGRRTQFPLSTTHRFGEQIAKIASSLTVVQPQVLKGSAAKEPRNHSVFLFSKTTIRNVIPAFGDLVLSEIPIAALHNGKCSAVGARRNYNGTSTKFPLSLGDYWEGFQSDLSRKPKVADSMIGYIASAASSAILENSYEEAFSIAISGVNEFVRRAEPGGGGELKSRSEFEALLRYHSIWFDLKSKLWVLIKPGATIDEVAWLWFVREVIELLSPVLPSNRSDECMTFVQWSDMRSGSEHLNIVTAQSTNILAHSSCGKSIDIHVDTIHAVKGETHVATLVVETFMRTHDIKSLLPVLTARKTCSSLTEGAIEHCKRVFVGITRPSELACLAICADNLAKGDAGRLEAAGWKIHDLS